jgi:hypothetical protein
MHIVMWQDKEKTTIAELSARIAALEKIISERLPGALAPAPALALSPAPALPSQEKKPQVTPLLSGMDVHRQCSIAPLSAIQSSSDTASILQDIINSSIAIQPLNLTDASLAQHPQKHESIPSSSSETSSADVEEMEVEDAEEEEEDVVEAEAEEEEEEEEAVELDEFEYKGVTYFKDAENQVYQVDADGDLDDSPIGVWSEEKGKILKYAKSS